MNREFKRTTFVLLDLFLGLCVFNVITVEVTVIKLQKKLE